LRQTIRIVLQPIDSLRTRQRLGGDLAVELGDHTVEFVDGAAEALPILLGEFRQLRACEREQNANRKSQSSNQNHLPSSRNALLHNIGCPRRCRQDSEVATPGSASWLHVDGVSRIGLISAIAGAIKNE
jgi:hypothetical protein